MKSAHLPPLDLNEDNKKYEAFNETKEIEFPNCKHKNTKIKNGVLSCVCGAAWSGRNLQKLQGLLNSNR